MKTLLFLLAFSLSVYAQDKIVLEKTGHFYTSADKYVGFDAFGFQYLINDNAFIKTNGKAKAEYKKVALGKITRADIRNPLLMVLYYEDYNTAILVDNQLNEIREIKFNDLEKAVVVHAIGLASQNRIWIFDSLTQQLMLFDYLKNTLTPLAIPITEPIRHYETDFNYFQWTDSKLNWYACDVFGKVVLLGKVPEHDFIRFVSGTSVLYEKDRKLFFHDVKLNTAQSVLNLDNSAKYFYYQAQILAIFTSSGITNYKINLP